MKILFVCLANTCRSPIAEAVMQNLIDKNCLDWQTDSAALRPWNIGREPTSRCMNVLRENGLKTNHLSRTVKPEDFLIYDYILCMDKANLQELLSLSKIYEKNSDCHIGLLGTYLNREEDEIIEDPYFSHGIGSFRAVFSQINDSCANFVAKHK